MAGRGCNQCTKIQRNTRSNLRCRTHEKHGSPYRLSPQVKSDKSEISSKSHAIAKRPRPSEKPHDVEKIKARAGPTTIVLMPGRSYHLYVATEEEEKDREAQHQVKSVAGKVRP